MYLPLWQLCILAVLLVALAGLLAYWYDIQVQHHEDNLERLLTGALVVDEALGDLHGEYGSGAVGVAHGCLRAAIVEAERQLGFAEADLF